MGRIIHGPANGQIPNKVKVAETSIIVQKEYVPTVIEMEKIVKIEVVKYVDKPIYIDNPIEVIKEIEKIVEVPVIQYVDKIIEKKVPIVEYKATVEYMKFVPMWVYLIMGLESVTILGLLIKGLYG